MGTTPNYAIPYPELVDPPDGATQMKALATKVDTQLKTNYDALNAGVLKIPFAVHTNKVAVANHGANGATNQVHTLPAGRFTQVPIVVCSAYCEGSRLNATVSSNPAPTVSGMTISTINLQANTATLCYVAWWAVQMTSGASPGLRAEPTSNPTHSLTCHTAGCDNAGLPIPMDMSAADVAYCGVCGQPIEDIRPV